MSVPHPVHVQIYTFTFDPTMSLNSEVTWSSPDLCASGCVGSGVLALVAWDS